MRHIILGLALSLVTSAVGAQAATARQEAALAAVRGVFSDTKSRTFEVVPDTDGTTDIAVFISSRLGLRMRSASEARSCHGPAGQCAWRPALSTIAFRMRPRTLTDDRAVFVIDAWWSSAVRKGTPEWFAQQTIVEVARDATGWRYVRSRPGLIIG